MSLYVMCWCFGAAISTSIWEKLKRKNTQKERDLQGSTGERWTTVTTRFAGGWRTNPFAEINEGLSYLPSI